MLTSNIVFHLAVICFINVSNGLERLSLDIEPATTISDVLNKIFSILKLKTKSDTKIKEYSTIHKYFVTLTLLENDTWKKVIKLTRLENKIVNGSTDFMIVINEVLNEENKIGGLSETLNDEDAINYIVNFLGTLESLKKTHLANNSYESINSEVLQHFDKIRITQSNNLTASEFDSIENSTDENEFWVPSNTRRIYRGERTAIKYFPFVASVQLFNQFSCAGSIIKSDIVITAASCLQLAHNNRFYRENPAFLSVRVGSTYYNAGGDNIPITEVYFHPTYTPKTLQDNLALMRLHRAIIFRKHKRVKKIDIDRNDWAMPMNIDGITILGWGAMTSSNKVLNPWKNQLSMATLSVYPLDDCQDIYSKKYVTKKHFCAGFVSKGGGACNRDVGGPGITHGILAGVVSFGSPTCGAADAPTVFTKLGYYTNWIEEIMEQERVRVHVRTTTRQPHVHTILTTHPEESTDFKIEPISLSKIKSIKELDLRSDQQQVFKEFLKTVFNSKEANEEYKKIITRDKKKKNSEKKEVKKLKNEKNDNKDTKDPKRTGTGTSVPEDDSDESFEPVPFVTSMDNFDTEVTRSVEEELADTTNLPHALRQVNKHGKKTTQKLTTSFALTQIDEEYGLSIENPVTQDDKTQLADEDNLHIEKPSEVNQEDRNIEGEELDKQINELIDKLNIEKVISSELIENLNDRKVIDDTKLLELMEKNDNNKKIDSLDETILTLLYLSESEGQSPKSNQEWNENEGLRKGNDKSNLTNNRYNFISRSEMYDILADAIQPE